MTWHCTNYEIGGSSLGHKVVAHFVFFLSMATGAQTLFMSAPMVQSSELLLHIDMPRNGAEILPYLEVRMARLEIETVVTSSTQEPIWTLPSQLGMTQTQSREKKLLID